MFNGDALNMGFQVQKEGEILLNTSEEEVLLFAIEEDGDFLEDNSWVERTNGECVFLSLRDWEGNVIHFHTTCHRWIINRIDVLW